MERAEARNLLAAAGLAAPLDAPTRFSRLLQASGSGDNSRIGTATNPAQGLGLSRDIATLAWMGGQLRLVGKTEASMRAYRQALELSGTVTFDRQSRLHSMTTTRFGAIGSLARTTSARSSATWPGIRSLPSTPGRGPCPIIPWSDSPPPGCFAIGHPPKLTAYSMP